MEKITVEIPENLLVEFKNIALKQYGKTVEEMLVEFVKWTANSPDEAKKYFLKYAE